MFCFLIQTFIFRTSIKHLNKTLWNFWSLIGFLTKSVIFHIGTRILHTNPLYSVLILRFCIKLYFFITIVIGILPVGRVWWMFFENFIIVRSYMTVLFHFLKSWIHRHKKDEIVIVITTLCIFRNAVQLKLIGMLFCASKNNCEPGTNFSEYLI